MKKFLLIAAIAVLGVTGVKAQETSFGVLGGFSMYSADFDGASESESGFHIGAMASLGISEAFAVQPELTYGMAGDFTLISLNVVAKYYVAEGFNIQAGPQLGFIGGDAADAWDDAIGDDFTKMNIQLAAGVGYDFTENFFAQARYGFQLNNHYTGDADADVKINSFNLSVGYKF